MKADFYFRCVRCLKKKPESTLSFSKRYRKDPLHPEPFFCYECRRIFKKLDQEVNKNFEQAKTQEEIRKLGLKKFVIKCRSNDLITEMKREDYLKRSAQYKKQHDKYKKDPAYIACRTEYHNKRRAMLQKCFSEVSDKERKLIKQFYKNKPKGYCIDHIIPLSKGGSHTLYNLQYLTPSENSKKYNKIIKELLPIENRIALHCSQYIERAFDENGQENNKTIEERVV